MGAYKLSLICNINILGKRLATEVMCAQSWSLQHFCGLKSLGEAKCPLEDGWLDEPRSLHAGESCAEEQSGEGLCATVIEWFIYSYMELGKDQNRMLPFV